MAIKKATAPKSATKISTKLVVEERLGCVVLNAGNLVPKKNSNGTPYIATPEGAVYANIDKLTVGLHTIVKFTNGALGLNYTTPEEKLNFLNDLKGKYPNMSMSEIKEAYGIE